jgi:putative glutamine amidotransferase
MEAPIIGITGHFTETSTGYRVVAAGQAYIDAVRLAGGFPVLLPPVSDEAMIRESLDRVDGVLFTGGRDVDPVHYGERILGPSVHVEPERDAFELPLIREAIARDMSVLAICRGCQVLNVALGGTLWQDLPAQRPGGLLHTQKEPRDAVTHPVRVESGSLLADLLTSPLNGRTEYVQANSFHHQAARVVPTSLLPVAFASDGTIEAIELGNRSFVLGVQWHPEHLVAEHVAHRRLFEAFVRTAARERRSPQPVSRSETDSR